MPNFVKKYVFFLQNLGWGRQAQVTTFTPIFTIVAFKMWAYSPQNAKIADCGE